MSNASVFSGKRPGDVEVVGKAASSSPSLSLVHGDHVRRLQVVGLVDERQEPLCP